jgi:hypothetical protein
MQSISSLYIILFLAVDAASGVITSGIGPVLFALCKDRFGNYQLILQLVLVLQGVCFLLLMRTPLPGYPPTNPSVAGHMVDKKESKED